MSIASEYQYIVDSSRLPEIAREIESAEVIALDLETTGLSPVDGAQMRLLSINTMKGTYVIDLFRTNGLGPIAAVLHNPDQKIGPGHPVVIGQNLKFDQKFFLYWNDIELWPVYDTFRASQLMWNGYPNTPHDLWSIQDREIHVRPRVKDLGASNWAGDLSQDQLDYSADDVIFLPRIRDAQKPKLNRLGLNRVAMIEFGSLLPEGAVELNGFYLNRNKWSLLARQNQLKRAQLQQELLEVMPDPNRQMMLPFGDRSKISQFNLESPQQMLESLRMMGLQLEDTKEVSLAMLSGKNSIVSKILDFREVAQRVKSFGEDYLRDINPNTGRIHPEYFGYLKAGRFSCRKPNLTQIPRDKSFRDCFEAEEGNVLVLADYSGIEMRIVAEISNDKNMMSVFSKNQDIHKVTASILLGLPYSDIDKSKKQLAKPINFGFCLTKGTRIITKNGDKNIEDMDIGDIVFTHKGNWKKVTATQKLTTKSLVRITTRTGKTVECTPDHMWYCHFPCANGRPANRGWVRAEDLKEGQYLVYHGISHGSNSIKIGVDKARMLGWFISEGSFSDHMGLTIAQSHIANPEVVDKMRKTLLPMGFNERIDGEMSRFYLKADLRKQIFNGPVLGYYSDSEVMSIYSKDKDLPLSVLDLVEEDRWALVSALFEGDGHTTTRNNRGVFQYSFISNDLRLSVQDLLDSLGINSTIYAYEEQRSGIVNVSETKSKKRIIENMPSIKLTNSYNPKKQFDAEEHIDKIEFFKCDDELVYDITVEDDHSFVANGLLTHNCYGMMPPKLILYAKTNYQVDMDLAQATKFREKYMAYYSAMPRWHRKALEDGKASKQSRTLSGRLRSYVDDENAHNAILNTPVQGTGADGLKASLRNVYNRFRNQVGSPVRTARNPKPKVMMCHHVHDEIILETADDKDMIEMSKKTLCDGMHEGMAQFLKKVPVEVEAASGKSWASK